MKNNFKNIVKILGISKFLIFAILLAFAIRYIQNHYSSSNSYKINISKTENILHQKEINTQNIINTYVTAIKAKNFTRFNNIITFNTEVFKTPNSDISVFIYENDTLRYWSNNKIETDKQFSNSIVNNRIANLNNAWYVIDIMQYKNFTLVGLILIKNKYSIQNQFLQNKFPGDFNLPPSIQVSMIPLSYSYDIKDKDNNYIFSLVPTNTINADKTGADILAILYFGMIAFILLFVQSILKKFNTLKNKNLITSTILFTALAVRISMIQTKIPFNLYSLDFFDPQYFAHSWLFASLGDFILNILLFIFLVYNVKLILENSNISNKLNAYSKTSKLIIFSITFTAIIFIGIYFDYLINNLINNSSISFEISNFTSLGIYSFSGFFVLLTLILIIVYLNHYILGYFIHLGILKHVKFIITLLFVFFLSYWIIFNPLLNSITIMFLFALGYYFVYIKSRKSSYNLYHFIAISVIASIYAVYLISYNTVIKHENESKLIIKNLANERDMVAELLLKDLEAKLTNDQSIEDYINKSVQTNNNQQITEYFRNQYFSGYWTKYNLDVTICATTDTTTINNLKTNCSDFFSKMVYEQGFKLPESKYYFINNQKGSTKYLLVEKNKINNINFALYILLESKLIPQELGYPELLLDENIKPSPINNYSYAKYKEHKLNSKSGDFSYNLTDQLFLLANENPGILILGNYRHTVYKVDNENTLVITRKTLSATDLLISFSYIFVLFNLILLLVYFFAFGKNNINPFQSEIRIRLIFSMIFILLFSFLMVTSGTTYYNLIQYRKNHDENVKEKIQSVKAQLEHIYKNVNEFTTQWDLNTTGSLDNELINLSQIFFSDINLYNTDGSLIATSRPELFKQGLIGTRMNQHALSNLLLLNKSEFIQKETIGNLEYTSAYIPLSNSENKIIAYINLPYFTRLGILSENLTRLFVTIINLYVVLLMVSIVVALILSQRIIQPIREIQNRLRKIEVGKKHEKIEYYRKDEIGELITEYNRMVEKLDESIQLLAKSERESAWREMAKQIAHEIKNPLTPMKLSIQHLLRSWEKNDTNFDEKLAKVSKTLIDQIDTLSSIATEFSIFAQMPKATERKINLITKIESIVQLFRNNENFEIETEFNNLAEIYINADKEQISRVFINLIKNATQAIPDGLAGKIKVEIKSDNNFVCTSITDNGTGIPIEIQNKLFIPSFTTKGSGSGLGLAIVKNIITNANGKIWFETLPGKGTTFFVEFPLADFSQTT